LSDVKQPNIVVFWGDDIGISNLSCYSDGLMGYRTPNIDRLAEEGMRFTDSYGEQSCTAGRSAFITGQSVYRTGLSKVGMPGSPLGLSGEDPTIEPATVPNTGTGLPRVGHVVGSIGRAPGANAESRAIKTPAGSATSTAIARPRLKFCSDSFDQIAGRSPPRSSHVTSTPALSARRLRNSADG